MRKLSFLAVAIAAVLFAACGGKKAAQTAEEQAAEKSFEQEQLEASIKQNFDSLAAEVAKLKQLPITEKNGKIVLTEEERQVKPDYLLNPAVAESATGGDYAGGRYPCDDYQPLAFPGEVSAPRVYLAGIAIE